MRTTPYKRPYVTFYFKNANDKRAAFVSRGWSSSPQGAIRAAVVRVFMGEYGKAVVLHRAAVIYTVRANSNGLLVRNESEEEVAA